MWNDITIVNDTQLEWACNINADETDLKYGYFAFAAISSVIGILGSVATYAPFLTGIDTTMTGALKFWIRTAAVGGTTASLVAGSAGLGVYLTKSATQHMAEAGFIPIPPNNYHVWPHLFAYFPKEINCVRNHLTNDHIVQSESFRMPHLSAGGMFHKRPVYYLGPWLRTHNTTIKDLVTIVMMKGEGVLAQGNEVNKSAQSAPTAALPHSVPGIAGMSQHDPNVHPKEPIATHVVPMALNNPKVSPNDPNASNRVPALYWNDPTAPQYVSNVHPMDSMTYNPTSMVLNDPKASQQASMALNNPKLPSNEPRAPQFVRKVYSEDPTAPHIVPMTPNDSRVYQRLPATYPYDPIASQQGKKGLGSQVGLGSSR